MRLTELRARWIGHPPRVGDYLMSTVRPRYAYRVEQVTNPSSEVHWDSGSKSEVRRLLIVAARVARDTLASQARVHPWRWDKRSAGGGSVHR